jgi:hypothetical protein
MNPLSMTMIKSKGDFKVVENMKIEIMAKCKITEKEFDNMLKVYREKIYRFTYGPAIPKLSEI